MYDLEGEIRSFRSNYSKNSYVWGIFDACRVSNHENSFVKVTQAQHSYNELDKEHYFDSVIPNEDNMTLVFSSEPSESTFYSDRVTRALFEWIEKSE